MITLLSFFLVVSLKSQQTSQTFVQEMHYLLYLPDGYAGDTLQKWPLLMFLHGSGECGDELAKLKVYGPPQLIEKGKKFPFIVVSPQAIDAETGFQAEQLKGLVEDLKKHYRVDEDRVYLTGLSMGGFATWELAEKHPEEFAAIAPLCSGGDTSKAWKLRHMKVWCFHGAKDDAVPLAASQQMVDAIKKYNPNVRFTIYPNANHNCWDVTYNNDSVYSWLLSQRRFAFSRLPIKNNALKEYVGIYTDEAKDTLKIVFQNGKFLLSNGSDKAEDQIEILPGSENSFFISETLLTEIVFPKTNNAKQSVLWVYDQQNKTQYHKVEAKF
jgi:predicted esterase